MTSLVDLRNAFAANVISPSTTGLTASGDSSGVDTLLANGPFVFDINVGTVTGTTPQCVFKVQESSDNTTFTDVVAPNAGPALTQTVTVAGSYQIFCAVAVKRYLRLDYVITGSATPTFPTSARVFADNRLTGTSGGFSISPQV